MTISIRDTPSRSSQVGRRHSTTLAAPMMPGVVRERAEIDGVVLAARGQRDVLLVAADLKPQGQRDQVRRRRRRVPGRREQARESYNSPLATRSGP